MTEMTIAGVQSAFARLTLSILARSTHPTIKRAMRDDLPPTIEIEKFSVGNFYYALTDDVIVGPGVGARREVSMTKRTEEAQNGQLWNLTSHQILTL